MADAVIHVLPEGIGQEQYDAVNQKLKLRALGHRGSSSTRPGKARTAGGGSSRCGTRVRTTRTSTSNGLRPRSRRSPGRQPSSCRPGTTPGSRCIPSSPSSVEDLGAPASYLTLEEGVEVYSSDGAGDRKGGARARRPRPRRVRRHRASTRACCRAGTGSCDADPGGRDLRARRRADARPRRPRRALPKPSANPGEIEVGPDDVVPDELHDKLRRAWDRISGKG